jgi:hypothetical protein
MVSNAILYLHVYLTILGYQLIRMLRVDNGISLASACHSLNITFDTNIHES